MACIYKIINDVNTKVYVGNTRHNIERRWKEHIRCSNSPRYKERPLYRAMNEYGIEHFKIELIEDCPNEISPEREIFWINYYNSYINGYNATYGGNGKPTLNKELILSMWKDGKTIKEISTITGYSIDGISIALHEIGVTKDDTKRRGVLSYSIPILMIDSDGNIIKEFSSAYDAARFLGKPYARQHIAEVCNKTRKTACGYRWKFK